MLIALFLFWLVLNANITFEIVITGLVLCTALYLFIWRFLGYSPKKEWKYLKRSLRGVSYLFWLVGQIFLSAVATIKMIWSPNLKIQPQLICFKTKLHSELGRVILSDSITLTPGTITVSIQEDELMVHCLDESFAEGIDNSEMQRKLIHLEGGKSDD